MADKLVSSSFFILVASFIPLALITHEVVWLFLCFISIYLALGSELNVRGFRLLNLTFYILLGTVTLSGLIYGWYTIFHGVTISPFSVSLFAVINLLFISVTVSSFHTFVKIKSNAEDRFVSKEHPIKTSLGNGYAKTAFRIISAFWLAFFIYVMWADIQRLEIGARLFSN